MKFQKWPHQIILFKDIYRDLKFSKKKIKRITNINIVFICSRETRNLKGSKESLLGTCIVLFLALTVGYMAVCFISHSNCTYLSAHMLYITIKKKLQHKVTDSTLIHHYIL